MSEETFGADLAADLRDIAAVVERDPEMAAIFSTFAKYNVLLHPSWTHENRKEAMAAGIRALKQLGPVKKDYSGEVFKAIVQLRSVELKLIADRADVCEAVVVGTREVEVPDPAAPLVKKTEDVIEWKCSSIMESAEVPA